jgi:hypothetical protein
MSRSSDSVAPDACIRSLHNIDAAHAMQMQGQSYAQRCPADQLLLMFRFVNESTSLMLAARTCRAWLQTLLNARYPLKVSLDQQPAKAIQTRLLGNTSLLQRHLTALQVRGECSLFLLHEMQDRLPHLRSLSIELSAAHLVRGAVFSFPLQLLSLTLLLQDDAHVLATLQLAVNCLQTVPHVEELVLIFPDHEGNATHLECLPQVDLHALTQLPNLKTLRLLQCSNAPRSLELLQSQRSRLSARQLAAIAQIRSLTTLDCNDGDWDMAQLTSLLSPSCAWQGLVEMQLRLTEVTEEILQTLAKLFPDIHTLHPMRISPHAYCHVGSFAQLETLFLDLSYPTPSCHQLDALCKSLNKCRKLDELWILNLNVLEGSNHFLSGLPAAVPSLKQLYLVRVTQPSLSFVH